MLAVDIPILYIISIQEAHWPFGYCNISIQDIANKFIGMQENASLSSIWGSGSISMQMVVELRGGDGGGCRLSD